MAAVPNCADSVAFSGDGNTAFMAPTTCVDPSSSRAKDPISVIDLTPDGETFVRDLPSSQIPLPFSPRNINISPSDDTLYLRRNDEEICVFSLAARQCDVSLSSADLVVN